MCVNLKLMVTERGQLYKLIEIDEKFKIFKGGMNVIDIGAAPGSWSQYASKKVKSGKIVSIDLKEMEKIKNTIQIKGDFTEKEIQNQIKSYLSKSSDVVMSDMAVNTTGIKNIDSIQTGELCKEAMIFSKEVISEKGFLFQKYLWAEHLMKLSHLAKKFLKKLRFLNPNQVEKTPKKVL